MGMNERLSAATPYGNKAPSVDRVGIFKDIVSYTYDPQKLDKDIQWVIATGSYQPAFSPLMIPYMQHETAHFKNAFNGTEAFDLTVENVGVICNDKMQVSPKKIREFLSSDHIESDTSRAEFNKAVQEEYFGSGFIHHYREKEKDHLIYLYDMVENPFYTLYTFAHELTHAMQDKNNFQPYGQKGAAFRTDYREIHANLTAGTFMMIKALQTQDKTVIDQTKQKLLWQSARMSNVMKTPKYGVRYFDWKGLNAILDDIPNRYQEMLTDQGEIDWPKLYDYTHQKALEMDYTPAKIRDTKAFLEQQIAPLWTKGTKNAEFGGKIQSVKGKDAIVDDFIGGFQYFMAHPAAPNKKVEQFYQQLAKPATREMVLNAKMNDTIPNIDTYRQLSAARKKSHQTTHGQ